MRRLVVALLSIGALVACGDRGGKSVEPGGVLAYRSSPGAAAPALYEPAPRALDQAPAYTTAVPVQRMITRTAQIRVVVSDPVASAEALTAQVEKQGGYVSDSRQWRSGEQMLANLTIHVPVRELEATLDSIRHRAIRVENESTSGADVTQQYTDLRARLTNLRATETELRALLATVRQRTQKAADILEVFNQLSEIRQQIDRTQAQITTLESLTALATITVDLVPDALAQPLTAGRWRPLEAVRAAFRTLLNTLKTLFDAAIWLLFYVIPVVLLLALPVLGVALGVRKIRRRLGGGTPPAAEAAQAGVSRSS